MISRSLILLFISLLLGSFRPAAAQEPDPVETELSELCRAMAGQATSGRRTWIEGILEADGIGYERLPFVHARMKGVNLEVRFGAEEGPALVLAAHHDARAGSAGANDDAAGCAVLLALARRLKKVEKPAMPLRIVFLDGSQKGLLGSQAWCESRANLKVDRALVLDLCGRGDRLVVGSSRRPYANRAPALVPEAAVLAGDLPTDHKAFASAGLDAAFLSLCPGEDLALLRGRYETRDLGAVLPAHITEVLRGRDRAESIEAAAMARALAAVLGAIERAALDQSSGRSPQIDFPVQVKSLDEALIAGDFKAAGKLAETLGASGFLEALARPAPATEEQPDLRGRTALRLVAGAELRAAISAVLKEPEAAQEALRGLKGRILFEGGQFRLGDVPVRRD